jgi:O-antigen/teichoic acid export membrane protein
VLLLSACTVVVISVATGIGVALLNDRLAEWTRTPELGHYLWLLPALTLGAGLYQVCGFWAIRRQAYSVLAKTRVEVNVGQAIVTVGLGVTMVGGVGLIVGKAVGTAIGAARLGAFVWRRDSAIARGITGRQVRGVATRYARFPLVAMPAMFLQSLQTKASVLLVAALYGPHAAGSLTFALGVIWVLTTVISDAVAQVYLGRAAEMARQNPEQLNRLFKRTVAGLLKIVAPPLALLGVVSPQLFTAIFGSEWLEAGLYLRSLMAAVIARLVIAVIFQTLTILERQAWVFLTNAAGVGLTAGALVASHHIGWTAEQAIVAYSASLVITYGALFVMARRTIGRAQHAFREDEPSTL